MKTITVTVDEGTIEAIDRIARSSGEPRPSRSKVVRMALHEFVAEREKRLREERDGQAMAANREMLAHQVEALVAEQADL